MPTFVLAYRLPTDYVRTPESGQAWSAWFQSMGDSLVDLGKPVVTATALGNHDAGTTELGGYSLVVAEDIEGAVAIAKGCPALSRDGGVEVGELGEIPVPVAGMPGS